MLDGVSVLEIFYVNGEFFVGFVIDVVRVYWVDDIIG